ncbi:MAG TPA: glycosyltransferase family 2 protein [Terriglobales bacterium]
MRVGAVTVTYNSGAVIDGFMESFARQSHKGLFLYVIDNASSDETLKRIGTYRLENLQVIANTQNLGIAEGNNRGIQQAIDDGCEAVLLINNDTEFSPDLVKRLVSGLEQYGCGIVTPKIVFYDKPNLIWSAGGGFNAARGYAAFHYGLEQEDTGNYDQPRVVQHAPACCALIRREVFERIGMIDPRYFIYLDDTDFSYRALLAGVRTMYLPEAKVVHKASSLTGGPESEICLRYRTRNQVYFMLKHLGLLRSLFFIPAYQIWLLYQSFRQSQWSKFWLRERALLEGLRLWHLAHSDPSVTPLASGHAN